MTGPASRTVIIFAIFLSIFLFFAGAHQVTFTWRPLDNQGIPDFSLYKTIDTLTEEQFPIDESHRRTIVVGDIHGMYDPLNALLTKLSYNPATDELIHTGDIVTKGPHLGSMAVLSFLATNNITGVRGNQDQKIIEWRGWINWIQHFRDGKKWLEEMEQKWTKVEDEGVDLEAWLEKRMKKDKSKWWRKIPDGWTLFGDHYKVARSMSEEEYDYLVSLPLVLHIPSAHAFVVHAGILPSDPHFKPSHSRQPLARVPSLPPSSEKQNKKSEIHAMRQIQEVAVLKEVPQNRIPWVTLNIRGILANHEVTREKDGKPWSEVWNRDISYCDGFDTDSISRKKMKATSLPCYPSTILYGHAASRGLDIKRWSIGLDSGCAYGRSLTALVLKSGKNSPGSDYSIKFGDNNKGWIVSVNCDGM